MSITLYPIQRTKLDELKEILEFFDEVCLAGSVGSGKTVIAMQFIEETKGLFYIQTYGQNFLLDQWSLRMNACMSQESIARTTIGLPHSYAKKSKIKYDYIIIDEAHQFTDASMTQKILEENPQAKRIYLTATPSTFVLKQTPIVCLSGIDLFKLGLSSDVYLGCVSTNTNIGKDDRNVALNVSTGALNELLVNIPDDMSKLYEGIIKRLRQIEILKDRPILSKKVTWANVFAKLDKTIIYCESIKQSEEVLTFLKIKKINCISSHSENDKDSENIKRFQDDKGIKVLVVVDRAQAGFDMSDLVNIVDMTFTHNVNRMYQMFGRVVRLSKEHDLKFFFKITNENDSFYTKFYMNVMINMMDEKFITKYNGKNLNDIELPMRIEKKSRPERADEEKEDNNSPKKAKQFVIDEDFFETISINDHFKFVESKFGSEFNEYAHVKISEIRIINFNDVRRSSEDTKQKIIEIAKNGGDKPRQHTFNKLGNCMSQYFSKKSSMYDEDFCNEIIALRPDWFEDKNERQKRIAFEKMIKLMPNSIKLKEGQIYKSAHNKLIFIHNTYGEFCKTPVAIKDSWKRGLSGHPNDASDRIIKTLKNASTLQKKRVKCIQTDEIFDSLNDARNNKGIYSNSDICSAIKRGGTAGGFNWEYVD